ncbi:MAG: sterol desaturase [Microbacterium sp.]|jgi:hypothetical protein|nr:sterol desaturase [Microbacterium sp.]
MKKLLASLALGTGLLMTSSCAPMSPTYEQVRTETDGVLQQVADLIPDPKTVQSNDEIGPYPCDEPLALGRGKGSFYTGQWHVFVEDSFDIPGFVHRFPAALGDGWHSESLGVPVSFAQVYLVRDTPRMSLSVEESTFDGRKAVELLAISRCGILPETPAP